MTAAFESCRNVRRHISPGEQKNAQRRLMCLLPGQDSNLRPIDYTYPYVSVGVDYIIILFIELGCEALRAAFADLLPCGIVSEPSMHFCKAWLLIALATNCALGFPAIHLICNIDYSIRLLFRTKSNVTVDCSTAKLPRKVV